MNRSSLGLLLTALLAIATGGASSRTAADQLAHSKTSASSPVTWRRYLQPPRGSTARLPADWTVGLIPEGFEELPPAQICGLFRPLITVDEMTRAASVIVVGTLAGHDGSFRATPVKGQQYTTYYLRVTGYLKDTTGRRAPFLKILASGGFLDGGQQGEVSVPYLKPGIRYLFYLLPNRGMDPGFFRNPDHVLGTGDENWVLERGIGCWWEDKGLLVGLVPARQHHEVPDEIPTPFYLPFGEGLRRVAAAVERERWGIPYVPPKFEEPKCVSPD